MEVASVDGFSRSTQKCLSIWCDMCRIIILTDVWKHVRFTLTIRRHLISLKQAPFQRNQLSYNSQIDYWLIHTLIRMKSLNDDLVDPSSISDVLGCTCGNRLEVCRLSNTLELVYHNLSWYSKVQVLSL